MNISELKKLIGKREVYIWGTRIAGLSACRFLEKNGIKITAFVDNIPVPYKKENKSVLVPEDFFIPDGNRFVIICTRGHSPHIAQQCKDRNIPYVSWEQLQIFDYYIEVNNRCNLNCITCSVREYYNEPLRNMTVSDFEKIVKRIRKEDPMASWLNLYGHNESFLCDNLSKMIEVAGDNGFAVGLSTNLAITRSFEDIIKAHPLFVRVSISGWGTTYERIHQNARFPVLLRNLSLLSVYRKKYAPDMIVEIFFHKYKHNEDDAVKISGLCEKLGFEFRTIYASVIGLETVSNLLDGRPVSRKIQNALPLLCHSVEETAGLAYRQKDLPCPNDHMVRIHSDGTVAMCLAWMGSVIPNTTFLEIPYKELEEKLMFNDLCWECRTRGLHQFCEVVFDEERVL